MTYKSIALLVICLVLTFVSCEKGINPKSQKAISFSYNADTRAVADYIRTNGDTITLWGYNTTDWVYVNAFGLGETDAEKSAREANAQKGFTATISTNDSSINIVAPTLPVDDEGEVIPEYWQAIPYHFYSLWPPKVVKALEVYRKYNSDNEKGPGIYFTFNTRTTQVDQLFAKVDLNANEAASQTTALNLEYNHILSQLVFNVAKNSANVSNKVVLDSMCITGIAGSGSFSYEHTGDYANEIVWLANERVTNKTTVVLYDGEGIDLLAGNGTQITHFIIPQDLETNTTKEIKLFYHYFDDIDGENYLDRDSAIAVFPVTTKINEWEYNKKYVYNIYLAPKASKIAFGTPTVESWNSKLGGSTIIIQK